MDAARAAGAGVDCHHRAGRDGHRWQVGLAQRRLDLPGWIEGLLLVVIVRFAPDGLWPLLVRGG